MVLHSGTSLSVSFTMSPHYCTDHLGAVMSEFREESNSENFILWFSEGMKTISCDCVKMRLDTIN